MDDQQKNLLIRHDVEGTYCLGFLNKHGLDVEEIRTIFSDFGKILNIKETGDNCGYRFIRFKYLNEAEKAVEGLRNHPKVTLVEHRQKPKNKSENPMNGNNRRGYNNCNENRNKYHNGNGNFKNNKQNGNFKEENQNSNGNYKEDEYWNEAGKEENQGQNNSEFKSNSNKDSSSNDNLYIAKSYNSLNSISDNDVMKHNVIDMICTKNELVKGGSSNSSLSNGSLFVEDDYDKLEIPNLIKSEKLKITNNVQKKVIRNAEEIIVGNIPDNFGSAFILHLFERYDPIAVSHINFVKNSAIRYCHVYFKTLEDSLLVQKTFDRMSLSGQKLLVLRPSQLFQEAAY